MSRLRAERTLLLWALAGGLPAVAVALVLLPRTELPAPVQWGLGLMLVTAWLLAAVALRHAAVFRLRTLSNLMAALREKDFSFRVRGGRRDDAFGELVLELNLLAQSLRDARYGEAEATALLAKVMGEIDVAVLAFDPEQRLSLVNPGGSRLLGRPPGELLGHTAGELGLAGCLEGSAARTITPPAGGGGRWELRRGVFRQQGLQHHLLVLSDVSRTLRAEELAAWQRLIRVLSHELNNSLTPIKSIAGSLDDLLGQPELPGDWRDDVRSGLRVIASRAEALNRLMGAYATLARLPQPTLVTLDVETWVRRVASLETRVPVTVIPGPRTAVRADGDQLDQALINLVRNAADAARPSRGHVELGWRRERSELALWVDDEGPGLAATANLFVPFFTTKPGGSGVGLALVRQIVEAHGGSVFLGNHPDHAGCRAVVRLPL
ncbi:MAG TPA: ATP-binding protein [Thermoanaerobaculaceae bacterium]|nr:ATP-binding protein [Thermoanaerobaculaceae bacterium]HPS79088.1 ATP-binding protein [Thermoanaerobaculaceae bacterium]